MTDWLAKIEETTASLKLLRSTLRPTKKNIANARRAEKAALRFAKHLQAMILFDPVVEQWWQEERLRLGLVDRLPTLDVMSRWCIKAGYEFRKLAESLERQAERKKRK